VAGRAAKRWVGVLAVACAAGGFPARAADPVPESRAPVPTIAVPPLPADGGDQPRRSPSDLPTPPPAVTVFQRPPGVLPEDAPAPQAPTLPPPSPVNPFLPQPPTEPDVVLPDGSRVTLPAATRQQIRFGPRYATSYNYTITPINQEDKEHETTRVVIVGGVIINVVYLSGTGPAAKPQEVEFATDNAVAWIRRPKGQKLPADLSGPVVADDKSEYELYLSGNVIIRTLSTDTVGQRTVEQVFRAAEVYYDVNRNRAVALDGDLELKVQGIPESVRIRSKESWQLSRNEWRMFDAETSASRRPAQPALTVTSAESTLVQRNTVRRNVFGIPYRDVRTGEPDVGYERILTSERVRVNIFDVPVFAWPRTRVDVGDPLGPLNGVGFGHDRIFGTQVYTTWDMYQLLALRPPPGHNWLLHADYLSARGPGLGTDYTYFGRDLFGLADRGPAYNQPYSGLIRMYGIYDKLEQDVLGGDRSPDPLTHPSFRGRAQWRHNQDLYENGDTYVRVLAQAEYLTDRNFLEQYYKIEFDMQPNQETFTYVYGAAGNLGGSILAEGNIARRWVTETEWMPRADGSLIGESFLWDRLNYSARGDAGYARLLTSQFPFPPVVQTDREVETGRFHLNQRLSAPFDLGPVRIDPYGVADLVYYTQDIARYNGGLTRATAGTPIPPTEQGLILDTGGDGRGRVYGGGGVKASVTLSRLYPDADSELFNVRGLYHKLTFGANYFNAYSDTPYWLLPQLDRLSDDTTDYTFRLARPKQTSTISGPAGVALATSPLFDPAQYAIRRLVDDKYDTMDTVQVLQLSADQRLQTKRGFPGSEHIVDWMTLNLSVSLFPDPNRDNYGKSWSFLEYYYMWHIGDRTSISSAGWFDPFEFGTRYFNLGLYFNRPDGTNFYLGYRYTDPIDSRALTGSISYSLTRKYSVNLIATYDFGVNKALSQQVNIARVGTDMTLLFGISYNALVNNFGVQFALVPNLAALAGPPGTTGNPFINPFLTRRY
jgi:hypothetical protein